MPLPAMAMFRRVPGADTVEPRRVIVWIRVGWLVAPPATSLGRTIRRSATRITRLNARALQRGHRASSNLAAGRTLFRVDNAERRRDLILQRHLSCIVNFGSSAPTLPEGEMILASEPTKGDLAPDTAAWVIRSRS